MPRPKEPRTFDKDVRQPGQRWLASDANPKTRPPSYWRKVTPQLCDAFSTRCGYTAMWDLCGTVDHFAPQSRDRSNLYEWDNLRYASQWINASKKAHVDILDPYDVEEGWFEVSLPSLQLVASDKVPPDKQALVQSTLKRLPITHDERVIRQRRAWLEQYEQGRVTLEGLYDFAPLLAAALEKQESGSGRKAPKKETVAKKKTVVKKKRHR
nr:hypothetical protein [Enhygromyxa salina]